jgi:hypothetical protein
MSPLAEFLVAVFREGRAVLRGRFQLMEPDTEAVKVLQEVYRSYRLQIAGPPIAFDPRAALTAARLLYHASWFLLSRDEPESELERLLTPAILPGNAAEHLSADLSLRFLPQIHRRARAHSPADRLTTLLADILRRWPLSGVLSDLDDGPLNRAAFDEHPGLLLLYAERLARHEKPAWVPQGLGLDYLDLVYHELGKDLNRLLQLRNQLETCSVSGNRDESDE